VEDLLIRILACPDNSVQVVADPVNLGQKILLVCGTNGNDVYVIEPRPSNLTQVRIKSTGKVIGIVNNSQFQSIAAFGKAGNDTIIVDAHIIKPARLFGDAGDDQLYGAGGVDRIHGGDGNDKLYGGNNNDILTGNAGRLRLWSERQRHAHRQ
jgi:Ca2+-binding RTX toxin-like protein